MTLLQLKYISTVAKCGSFSNAAQKLYVSQPGISKMVSALEEELGIDIFVRSSSGITLTAEGRALVNMADKLLADAERISTHFQQDERKAHEHFSVSSQHYCFVVDAFTELMSRSDKELYNYKLLLGQNPEVIHNVSSKVSEIGVLFISNDNRKYMDRIFEENNLEFHKLIQSIPYVFFTEDHPLAGNDSVRLEDLQPYPCIIYDLDSDSPSILQEEFLFPGFYPKKTVLVNGLYQSAQVMLRCNGYDLGTGVCSASNSGLGIVKKPLKGFDTPISIGWICLKSHILSQPAKKFIECLKKYSVE